MHFQSDQSVFEPLKAGQPQRDPQMPDRVAPPVGLSRFWSRALSATLLLLVFGEATAQRVVYVDSDAAGLNDGSSWSNAFNFLQDALSVARNGDEVWLAEGVYRPDRGAHVVLGDQNAAFVISRGIGIYGGFVGGEQLRDSRDCRRDRTILSGDLRGNDVLPVNVSNPSRSDNAYRIVVSSDRRSAAAAIDCLTIADGNTPPTAGGVGTALWAERPLAPLRLSRLDIRRNAHGGAPVVYIWGDSVTTGNEIEFLDVRFAGNATDGPLRNLMRVAGLRVVFEDVEITDNHVTGSLILAGDFADVLIIGSEITRNTFTRTAVETDNGPLSLTILNSRIVANVSTDTFAPGALSLQGGDILVANTIIAGNSGDRAGAISMGMSSHVQIVNSLFAYNRARRRASSGAIWLEYSADLGSVVSNSIFWQNDGPGSPNFSGRLRIGLSVQHSIIEGLTALDMLYFSGQTIEADPLFKDAYGPDGSPGTIDDDYHLLAGSPAIDSGTLSALPYDFLDLDTDDDLAEPLPWDLDGAARQWDPGANLPGGAVDIGPYEFASIGTSMDSRLSHSMTDARTFSLFPNPMRQRASGVLRWESTSSHVRLVLFDVTGRLVATLFAGHLATQQEVSVGIGTVSPGLYFVANVIGGQVGQLIVVR